MSAHSYPSCWRRSSARAEGSQPDSTGVGFAIASNLVAAAVKKIEAGGGVSAGSSGVTGGPGEGGSYGSEGGARREGQVVIVP